MQAGRPRFQWWRAGILPALCLAASIWLGESAGAAALDPAAQPKAVPALTFTDGEGRPLALDAFKGKVVVLDYWATWCTPCRTEFPALDRLQERLGSRGVQVVAVSLDRNGVKSVDGFYHDLAIGHLAKYLDPTWASAHAVGVEGLPTALVIDRQGREVARAEGPVDWDGAPVTAFLERLLEP
jgi:thiol-disulfide isomerase/thioredoxin